MAEPRISVLIVARDEAHNLAECLAAAHWADERVVVVDAASRDATLAIARRDADVVAVRAFDDFAGSGIGLLPDVSFNLAESRAAAWIGVAAMVLSLAITLAGW